MTDAKPFKSLKSAILIRREDESNFGRFTHILSLHVDAARNIFTTKRPFRILHIQTVGVLYVLDSHWRGVMILPTADCSFHFRFSQIMQCSKTKSAPQGDQVVIL